MLDSKPPDVAVPHLVFQSDAGERVALDALPEALAVLLMTRHAY